MEREHESAKMHQLTTQIAEDECAVMLKRSLRKWLAAVFIVSALMFVWIVWMAVDSVSAYGGTRPLGKAHGKPPQIRVVAVVTFANVGPEFQDRTVVYGEWRGGKAMARCGEWSREQEWRRRVTTGGLPWDRAVVRCLEVEGVERGGGK